MLVETTAGRNLKLPRSAIILARGLLPMWYKPGELAEDLQVPLSTLRDWLKAGAPHRRDASGHIWIAGHQFAAWVEQVRQAKKSREHRRPLADNEAWCLSCDRPVPFVEVGRREHGRLVLASGTCPECGAQVNRGGRRG